MKPCKTCGSYVCRLGQLWDEHVIFGRFAFTIGLAIGWLLGFLTGWTP